jgi:hypothetical protein
MFLLNCVWIYRFYCIHRNQKQTFLRLNSLKNDHIIYFQLFQCVVYHVFTHFIVIIISTLMGIMANIHTFRFLFIFTLKFTNFFYSWFKIAFKFSNNLFIIKFFCINSWKIIYILNNWCKPKNKYLKKYDFYTFDCNITRREKNFQI